MTNTVTLAEHATALGPEADAETIYDTYTDWVFRDKGFELYPAQQEALLAACLEHNVVLATPTGTGKTLVALGAHFKALTRGERSIYTAPIKALVSEKFFELVAQFGAHNVGMVTGDFSINPEAPILCATAEILAQYCLADPAAADITTVIMDEFHFYADPERGWAWQVPLLTAQAAQFVLMSATLGDMTEIIATLKATTGRETVEITGVERPVPLHFKYAVQTVQDVVAEAVAAGKTPLYLVHFSQREATLRAQHLKTQQLLTREQEQQVKQQLAKFRFAPGYGRTLKTLLLAGVGVHHAGMLPKYRRLVEQLAQQGLLRVICGTDTLGVGINVPIRTVVLTSLVKYDGKTERRLTAREFHQVAGRAGRAGFDAAGDVIVVAPEHEVHNAQLDAKYLAQQAKNPQKKIKPPRKQKPAGVTWSAQTAANLEAAAPGPLQSRMRITNAMLLAFSRRGEQQPGQLVRQLRQLIWASHETPARKYEMLREAIAMLRSMLAAGILLAEPVAAAAAGGGKLLRLANPETGGVSLNSPLALFGIAALELLDQESPSYTLDVISVLEATLEDPPQILFAQQQKLKRERLAQLKADGVEYDERQRILDDITYPQPLSELLTEAFERYAAATEWIKNYAPAPKSVVRDFIENAFSFRSFVTHYDLERVEGVLLRYLTDAYRALRSSVPQDKRTPQFTDILEWLGTMVRQVDSSLLDEWEALAKYAQTGELQEIAAAAEPELIAPASGLLTSNDRAFRIMVQNALFRVVMLIAAEDTPALVACSHPEAGAVVGAAYDNAAADAAGTTGAAALPLDAAAWDAALDDYFEECGDIVIDGTARSPELLRITKDPEVWHVEQVVMDPDAELGWAIFAEVDLRLSNELGEVALTVTGFKPRF